MVAHFKVIALPKLEKFILAIVSFVFVHKPDAYLALGGLIAIDTVTGYLAAKKRGTANSKTLKFKLLSKLMAYILLLAAYGLFYRIVVSGQVDILSSLAEMFGVLVIASVGAVELRSIVENIRAISNVNIPLFKNAQEIQDYLEANHVSPDNAERELDGNKHNSGTN
jgi:hypothetical protein